MQRFLESEVATANMPRIRIQPKSTKRFKGSDEYPGYPMSSSANNYQNMRGFTNMMDVKGGHKTELYDYNRGKSDHKPRLNYELLIAKA